MMGMKERYLRDERCMCVHIYVPETRFLYDMIKDMCTDRAREEKGEEGGGGGGGWPHLTSAPPEGGHQLRQECPSML